MGRLLQDSERGAIGGGPDLFEMKAPPQRKPRRIEKRTPDMSPDFGDPLPVDDDAVRRRAFELWQAAGRPQGPDLARWFEGVAPMRRKRRH